MSEMRDITEAFVKRPRTQKNMEKFRTKCVSMPMVKECAITMSRVAGQKVGDNAYVIEMKGEVEISGPMSTKMKVIAEGNGELDGSSRMLTIKDVNVANDVAGIMGQMLSWAGFAEGKTIEMKHKDAEWFSEVLS
jgi:hypothetical protein